MLVQEDGPYGQLMLFGDSITEQSASQELGFAFMPALQDLYIRKLDVINRGFSGYNTAQALKILPSFMPTPTQASVQILVIFFGANDACLPGEKPEQHIPLDRFRQNLRDMIHHSSVQAHSPLILLITPPPIDERTQEIVDHAKGFLALRRTAENTKLYADACIQVGEDENVLVLNLWKSMMERAGWRQGEPLPGSRELPQNLYLKKILRDGLHLSPDGYKELFSEVKATIEANWCVRASHSMPYRFPVWNQAST